MQRVQDVGSKIEPLNHTGSSNIMIACICNASSKQIGHGKVAGQMQYDLATWTF